MGTEDSASKWGRIGLALSGGGFRASLFHLGVIRRLEELGIMKKVDVVSSVSGGSILAAFYLCEMEKRLREARQAGLTDDLIDRVDLFEKIAERFLHAVDHNLRTRALIFTPFYHPWLWVNSLAFRAFRRGARAELIQAEYDKWLFFHDTLDQLPVERTEPAKLDASKEGRRCPNLVEMPFFGPRLILNTTSLLSGQRVSFSRDTSSGIKDLKTSDRNVLLLSKVVGASSGVPVLFPPTAILGDVLVDGGISDNQGLEALMEGEDSNANGLSSCDVILVSDASGQLQVQHTMATGPLPVYSRVNDIFQFQIRNKLLARLCQWGRDGLHPRRRFAFVHLLVNLKSRYGAPPRVSTEILPALGRIRTDLDQFSFVECEALMYHGYTLIDAQLKEYCCDFIQEEGKPEALKANLKVPPLFRNDVQRKWSDCALRQNHSNPIRDDLEAGSESLYLLRCWKKYGLVRPLIVAAASAWLVILWFLFSKGQEAVRMLGQYLSGLAIGATPGWLGAMLGSVLGFLGLREVVSQTIASLAYLAAAAAIIAVAAYLVSFPLYVGVNRLTRTLDRKRYRTITGEKWNPSVHWD